MTAASRNIVLPQSKTAEGCEAYSRFAGVVVCLIGEIVLAAWLEILPGRWLPSLGGMTPIAALGIILAGLGLLCFTFRRIRFLSRLIGVFLFLFGLLMLGQGALGLDLGLDDVLIPRKPRWRVPRRKAPRLKAPRHKTPRLKVLDRWTGSPPQPKPPPASSGL